MAFASHPRPIRLLKCGNSSAAAMAMTVQRSPAAHVGHRRSIVYRQPRVERARVGGLGAGGLSFKPSLARLLTE